MGNLGDCSELDSISRTVSGVLSGFGGLPCADPMDGPECWPCAAEKSELPVRPVWRLPGLVWRARRRDVAGGILRRQYRNTLTPLKPYPLDLSQVD